MSNFLLNLNLVLAHTIVYDAKEGVAGNIYYNLGGDPIVQPVQEQTGDILTAYTQRLPDLVRVASGQILPLEQAKLLASQAVSPEYAALQQQLFQTFGPQASITGSQIAQQQALDQARTDAAVMAGPGQQLVQNAMDLERKVNPEFYATREAASNQMQNLLGSLNPTGLSASEQEALNRGLNQQNINRGTQYSPSQTATVSNAMTFGDALNKKQQNVANILGLAGQFTQNMQSGFDPYMVATGKPSRANLGDTKFTGVQNTGTDSLNMGQAFLNNLSSLKNNEMNLTAQRKSGLQNSMDAYGWWQNNFGVGQFKGIL